MGEPTRLSDHEICVLQLKFQDDNTHVDVGFKANVYCDGTILWEIRRVLEAFYTGTHTKWFTHKFVKKQKDFFIQTALDVGSDLEQALKPSMRSFAAEYPAEVVQYCDPKIAQEWQMETDLLLAWLTRWTQERRYQGDKTRATLMLKAFFQGLVHPRTWVRLQRFDGIDNYKQWCPLAADIPPNSLCPHMQGVMSSWESHKVSRDPSEHMVFLLAELRLAGKSASCMGCMLMFEDFVEDLSNEVDIRVAGLVEATSTVENLDHLKTQGGHRRRIDKDFKLFVARKLVETKRVHNAGQFLRAATELDDRLGRFWEIEVACSQWLCQKRHFTCNGVTGLTEDAARNGRPAEDTTVYLLWDADTNLGGVLPFQVTSDWHGAKRNAQGNLAKEAKKAIEDRYHVVFGGDPQDDFPTKRSLVQAWESNVEKLQACDHALREGTKSKGLKNFMVMDFPCGKLSQHEERYTIPAEELPEEVSLQRPRRSCIVDKRTDSTRLEVIWSNVRPSLWQWVDGGSSGWPSKLLTHYRLPVRGDVNYDPPHRWVRNRQKALTRSGINFVINEWSVVFQWVHGPFNREANFRMFQAAFEEIRHNFDWTFQPYQEFYPWIVHDMFDGNMVAGFGTEAHMRYIWDELPKCAIIRKMGEKQVKNRWDSWAQKFRVVQHNTGLMAMVLMHIETVRGVVGSVKDIPYFGGEGAIEAPEKVDLDPDEDEGDAGPGDEGKAVALSNHDVDALRRKTKNAAHLTLSVLTNRVEHKLGVIVARCGQVFEVANQEGIAQRKTQRGCFEWIVGMSNRAYDKQIKDTFNVLSCPSFVHELGLTSAFDFTGGQTLKEDYLIAETALEFVRELVAAEIEEKAIYSERPPIGFLGVLSRDPEARRAKLDWAKAVWDMTERFEQHIDDDPVIKASFDKALWPTNACAREWLVGFFEMYFQKPPPNQEQEMREAAKVCCTSVPTEEMHNEVTDQCRQSKAGVLGRQSKYHRMMLSGVWEESDRSAPRPTIEGDRVAKTVTMKQDMFTSTTGNFSLGDQVLQDIRDRKPHFNVPGLTAFFESAPATHALIKAKVTKDLQKNWLALVVQPGTILFHKDAGLKQGGYVLSTSEHNVVCATMTPRIIGGIKYFEFERGDRPAWFYVELTSLGGWVVCPVEAAPPAVFKDCGDGRPKGIAAVARGNIGYPVVVYAAKFAFRGLSKHFLGKLIKELELAERVPTLEIEMVKLLVTSVLPDLEPAELAEILAHRRIKCQPKFNAVLTEENIEEMSKLLGSDLTEDMKHDAKEYAKAVEATKEAAKAVVAVAKGGGKGRGKGGRGKGKGKGVAPLRPVGEKDHETVAKAKTYLPPGTDAGISLETKWFLRWKVTVPSAKFPPYSKSLSFKNTPEEKRKALFYVLNWVWETYREANLCGDCPFDFEQ